jgi:hypothetical protein
MTQYQEENDMMPLETMWYIEGLISQKKYKEIIDLFEDDNLCIHLSENAIKSAAVWHNRTKNIDDMISVYKTIMEDTNA